MDDPFLSKQLTTFFVKTFKNSSYVDRVWCIHLAFNLETGERPPYLCSGISDVADRKEAIQAVI